VLSVNVCAVSAPRLARGVAIARIALLFVVAPPAITNPHPTSATHATAVARRGVNHLRACTPASSRSASDSLGARPNDALGVAKARRALNMDSVVVVDRRQNPESRATGRPTSDGWMRWWLRFSMGGTIVVGLLHLYQADTVSVYQRIRLFVWANSVKIADFDTYQEIPDTGHF
jgi:hypothetical protein